MIDVENFPFLAPKLESLGEKSEKTCLAEFSGVPAYNPLLVALGQQLRELVKAHEEPPKRLLPPPLPRTRL